MERQTGKGGESWGTHVVTLHPVKCKAPASPYLGAGFVEEVWLEPPGRGHWVGTTAARTFLAEEFHRGCDPRSLTMDPLSWAGDPVELAVKQGEQSRSSLPERGAGPAFPEPTPRARSSQAP